MGIARQLSIKALVLAANAWRPVWLLKLVRGIYQRTDGRIGLLQDPDTVRRLLPGLLRPRTGHTVDMRIVAGARMQLDLDDHIQYRTFMDGYFDLVPLLLAERLCDSTTAYLDVGANIGSTAIPTAARGIPTIAIEAAPAILATLYANIALNPGLRITVLGVAAGDRDGDSVRIYPGPAANTGTTSLFPQWASDRTAHDGNEVRMFRLDTLLGWLHPGPVGFVKIDVEGAEALVLRGGRGLLSNQAPAVLFEHRTDVASQAGMGVADVAALFPQGYAFFGIRLRKHRGKRPALQLEAFDPGHAYENVLALHGEKPAHQAMLAALQADAA